MANRRNKVVNEDYEVGDTIVRVQYIPKVGVDPVKIAEARELILKKEAIEKTLPSDEEIENAYKIIEESRAGGSVSQEIQEDR